MGPLGFRGVSFRMIPPPATLANKRPARKATPKEQVATLPGIRMFWRAAALAAPAPLPT
jgi:hypothetical protein